MSLDENTFNSYISVLNRDNTKDTRELKNFLKSNKPSTFISNDSVGSYYLHFSTSGGYQFALVHQRRSLRELKIRTFKSLDTAIKYAERFGITVVTVNLMRVNKTLF